MKYTSLFCAAIAAMGMQAFAEPARVAGDDFNADKYNLGGLDAVEVKTIDEFSDNGWTVVGEDQSAIVTTHFDNGGQALKLNTNGETLTLNAATQVNLTPTVSMKVEMVASDTMVDMTGDTTTQTALFLYKPDENAEAGTLMAFSYDTQEGNCWVALTDDNFTALDDKDVADITIVINYASEEATYTVNGTTFAAIPLANPTAAATHKLSSVAFRGTGFVDDLFVSEEQTGTFATFIYELADEEPTSQQKDISAANFSFSSYVDPQTGSNTVAVLYSRSEGVDTKMSDLTLTDDTWSITDASQFVEGGTYVVKVTFEVKSSTITIYKNSEDAANLLDTITQDWFTEFTFTPPQGAAFEGWELDGEEQFDSEVSIASLEADAYVIVLTGYEGGQSGAKTWTTADVVANSFSWTGYDPAAGTATFTCTLNGVPAQGDSFGSFTVTTATVLGGATTDQAVTIVPDLTALPTLTGTVSGLPTGGNGLFLLGVKDAAAAPAAGE